IGKAHPGAAEAALVELLDAKAWLERHSLQRRAHRPAAVPQRPRRQPDRALGSRAAELNGADDPTVAVNAPGAARPIETTYAPQPARRPPGSKLPPAPRRPRASSRPRSRPAQSLAAPLSHYRRRSDRNRPLTIRIRRDFARCWSTNPQHGYPILTTMRPRTRP